MDKGILERIYQRMKTYHSIKDMAVDSPKIANLATEEVVVSFLEIVYLFDGLDDLVSLLLAEDAGLFKLRVAAYVLPFDAISARNLIVSCLDSNSYRVKSDAQNVLDDFENVIEGYKLYLNKIKEKRKIKDKRQE